MPQNKNLSRRDALKTLAAATGAVALTSLPGKWDTPVVEVGALPAHAQSSLDDLRVTFTTTSLCQDGECAAQNDGADGEYVDFDAYVNTPDDTAVYVWDDPHQGVSPSTSDNVDPHPNSNTEGFVIRAGEAETGCYETWVDGYYDGTALSVTIVTPAGSRTFTRTIDGSDFWHVADVCYPGGIISEVNTISLAVSAEGRKVKHR